MINIAPIIEAKAELTHRPETNEPVILSTRVRLARNLAQYPFPGWAKESQRQEILDLCLNAFKSLEKFQDGATFRLDELSELEKLVLVERHLISRELVKGEEKAGVIISRDQSCAIMVNEEDHLRIQFMRGGFNFQEIWQSINLVDSAIEDHLDYAFSTELGFLTACPTNLGTAMRASAMMHLPMLVMSGHMDKVIRAVNQLGIAVRGLFGEGSDATGSIFQISNQQTLGESEEDIIKRLTNVLKSVIEQENNARLKFIEDNPEKLFDKIGRAYGILRNGHVLSSEEAMNLLSVLRLAVDLRILPEENRCLIDRLFIESQPGHVQYTARQEIEPTGRDLFRATYIREQIRNLPDLNLEKALELI